MTDLDKHLPDTPESGDQPPAEPLPADPSQTLEAASHEDGAAEAPPPLTDDPSQHGEADPAHHDEAPAPPPAPAPQDGEPAAAEAGEAGTAAAEAAPPAPAPEPSDEELLAEARRWGLVDEEGNVRQRLADGSPGRILSQAPAHAQDPAPAAQTEAQAPSEAQASAAGEALAEGQAEASAQVPEAAPAAVEPVEAAAPGDGSEVGDPEAALLPFARKYRQIAGKVAALERDTERAPDRSRLVGRIHSLLEWLPTGDVLGDVDALVERLRRLEETARGQLLENLRRKEELAARAEALVESTAWTKTADAFKALQAEWKKIGPVPGDAAEAVWSRFRAAANQFFERRKAHHDERDREMQANLVRKEELCARAEELAGSTAWNKTAEALKGLQEEWRKAGPVPRDRAEAVWARFRAAMDAFFERRKTHFRQVDQELKENLRKKEALCVRAEELSTSTEWKATTEAIKALQAEWKAVGPVPHKQSEAIWGRFRGAIDVFFARSNAAYEERVRERESRQGDWKERLRETLERKREQAERIRESIARDDENLERWRGTLDGLRPGPRAAEVQAGLEEKMASVGERRASKQGRLEELEAAIREIEGKL